MRRIRARKRPEPIIKKGRIFVSNSSWKQMKLGAKTIAGAKKAIIGLRKLKAEGAIGILLPETGEAGRTAFKPIDNALREMTSGGEMGIFRKSRNSALARFKIMKAGFRERKNEKALEPRVNYLIASNRLRKSIDKKSWERLKKLAKGNPEFAKEAAEKLEALGKSGVTVKIGNEMIPIERAKRDILALGKAGMKR